MSLVSHGCSRSSDSRRSAYFDHLSGGGRKRPSVDFASSAYFDHLLREWSCSHVRPGKSQARKRRLGPAKIDWLIQPGTVHQHHERHLSRKKKERTSAVEQTLLFSYRLLYQTNLPFGRWASDQLALSSCPFSS